MRLFVVTQFVTEYSNDLCRCDTVLSQQRLTDNDLPEHGLRISMYVVLIGSLKLNVILFTASIRCFLFQVWHESFNVIWHGLVL